MWAQLKVKVRVNGMPRSLFFPKLEKFDTTLYLLGWGGAVTDAETTITPVLRFPTDSGVGVFNAGRVRNEAFEKLAVAQSQEADPRKREELVKAALREYRNQVHVIPLHRQVIPWAARSNVDALHRADNWMEATWVTLR
jgi:peptide/nickel transport system substrate-binding protein